MNNRKNKIYLLFVLCFIVILGIIFIPNVKKNYKDVGSNEYATAQIEGFEKSLFGSTGWAAIDLPLKESSSSSSNIVTTVSAGQPFLILGQNGSYWEIKYNDYHGYIEHNYCMINLPDVVPSIKYNIANSYSAIYKSSGNDIDGATGKTLYGTNCSNGLCQKISDNGKIMNNKIGRSEHIVPSLYSTSLKIAQAQTLALNEGYSLMIYDSYRPRSVSTYVAQKLGVLYKSNSTVRSNIDTSTGASGTTYSWGQAWFLAQGMSSHNVGSAIDVTLFKDGEVVMPTVMHELSTAAIKYYSPEAPRDSSGYSTGMLNSPSAQKLDNYMTSVGMGTLASEWWHFQDNEGLNLLRNATSENGCDFQVTSVLSNYGFTNNLTTVGDVNGDESINDADAELIYNLYMFLQDNTCDTCGDLIHYSDFNNNNQLDLDDVYSILNLNNDLITSSMYSINDDYINVGYYETFNSDNVVLKNVSNVSREVSNNKYLVKFHNTTIKSFDIVSYSYTGHALDEPYIFNITGPAGIYADIVSGDFVCVNCIIDIDDSNNKVYIKRTANDQQNLAEYDVVYFTSPYLTADGVINSPVVTVGQLLDSINCYNCEASVYNNRVGEITTGEILEDSVLDINENVTNSNARVKRVSINFAVTDVLFDDDNTLNLHLDEPDPTRVGVTVFPSYASNKNISFESSNTSVVTVDDEGRVTPVGVGNATITVTTEDGNYTDTRDVIVDEYATYRVNYIIDSIDFPQMFRYGEKINISFDALNSKEGYRFVGWEYDGNIYGLNDNLTMPRKNVVLVARWEPITVEIQNYTVEGTGNNKIIKGISLKTDVTNLDLGISSAYTVSVYESNGTTVKSSGNIGTGNVIKIFNGNELVESYTVSIKGDVNGDGDFKVGDIVKLYNYLFDVFPGDCYKDAADYNNDGQNLVGDVVKMYNALFNN